MTSFEPDLNRRPASPVQTDGVFTTSLQTVRSSCRHTVTHTLTIPHASTAPSPGHQVWTKKFWGCVAAADCGGFPNWQFLIQLSPEVQQLLGLDQGCQTNGVLI